ncbi:hypothetical protein [Cupriavidus sp. 8B]
MSWLSAVIDCPRRVSAVWPKAWDGARAAGSGLLAQAVIKAAATAMPVSMQEAAELARHYRRLRDFHRTMRHGVFPNFGVASSLWNGALCTVLPARSARKGKIHSVFSWGAIRLLLERQWALESASANAPYQTRCLSRSAGACVALADCHFLLVDDWPGLNVRHQE